MAQQVTSLARASLRDLPVEMYVSLMERIPDFSALDNFVNAFPRMTPIFKAFQKQIFTGVLRSSGLSLQLQKIIAAIMTLRDQYPATPCPPKAFFYVYLDRKDQPVDMIRFADPIGMLRYVVRTTESINDNVESFVRMRILGRGVTNVPLKDTETYRVRRAFWRFQLCYELCHPEGSVDMTHNAEAPERWARRYINNEHTVTESLTMKGWLFRRGEPQAPLLKDFLQTLWPWEIEELKVACFHLTTQVNAFQYNRIAGTPDDLRNQNLLLQRLVMDLDNWHADPENPRDHLLVTNLQGFQREPYSCHDPVWPDNPLAVGSNNVEPADLNDLHRVERQWGWCMWDLERLESCGPIFLSNSTRAWFGNTLASAFRSYAQIMGFVDGQFSAIDNELVKRFRRQFEGELQAYDRGQHMRRREWLMTWISTRDPGLYREWRDICERTPFDTYRATTCYLRALNFKRATDWARHARP